MIRRNPIRAFCILLFFLILGEVISKGARIPVPGNVIGMALLTLALMAGWVKLESVERVSDALLKHLALLFVPPGVGVMVYADLIRREGLALLVSTVLSTIVVLVVTAQMVHGLEKLRSRSSTRKEDPA